VITKADKCKPEDLLFSDQYKSNLKGKVVGKRRANISSTSYCGGTMFDAPTRDESLMLSQFPKFSQIFYAKQGQLRAWHLYMTTSLCCMRNKMLHGVV
jgi:hypothetical protein